MDRPTLNAILGGGFIAGFIDLCYACAYYGAAYDVAPVQILQSIAAGWVGREAALAGGDATAFLGLASHYAITLAMAAAYVFASRRAPILTRRWALGGLSYGLGLWLVMNLIVVPLSAAPAPTFRFWDSVGGIAIHMVGVGLPIAWFAVRTRRADA